VPLPSEDRRRDHSNGTQENIEEVSAATGQKKRGIERIGDEELWTFNCLVAIPRIFKKRQNTSYGILY
jgi:hypothetical protein